MKLLNILIRCDASIEIGLGHVTRCLVLANELKNKGHSVYFALKNFELGISKVSEQGFQYFLAPTPFNYHQWIITLSSQLEVNIFIGDIRDGLAINTIDQLKENNILTVAIDEPSDYRKACDLCFYPPHAPLDKLDWTGFNGEIKQGLEYVLLRPEFYQTDAHTPKKEKKILVMMGGTDPFKLAKPIVKLLKGSPPPFSITVLINKEHTDYRALENISDIVVESNINNMANFLSDFSYAITSFGSSAYELLAMGIPATYICLDKEHWASCKLLTASCNRRVMYNNLKLIDINAIKKSAPHPQRHIANRITEVILNEII